MTDEKPVKTTKALVKWENRRMVVQESLDRGLEGLMQSEVVTLGIALAQLAREWHVATWSQRGGIDTTIDQLHRSLGSVPANLVEGLARGSGPSELNFALISRASAHEAVVHAQILRWAHLEQVRQLTKMVDHHVQEVLSRCKGIDID